MRGILSVGGYVPHSRLQRSAIGSFLGSGSSSGTRSVASYDEDTTTMAVAAARIAAGRCPAEPDALWLSTASPTYQEKTNAGVAHAALRLPETTMALDAGGAARSAVGVLDAACRSTQDILVTASEVRTGRPGSPDEAAGGDGAAALLIGDGAADTPVLAEFLGSACVSREFLDRWRVPGEHHDRTWEERFGEGQLTASGLGALDALLEHLELPRGDVDTLVVSGASPRAVKALGRKVAADADGLAGVIGNCGGAHPLLLLVNALEHAAPGQTVVVLHLADGATALAVRATDAIGTAQLDDGRRVSDQVATGDDGLAYARFLAWRGMLEVEPPNRPAPARASAPAAARHTDWKFGFVGSRDRSSGALHLPPARVSFRGGTADDMDDAPMADVLARVKTFTVDRMAYSPSPPVVFAVVDFDGGGRLPVELTDCRPDEVAVGAEVAMTFRRIGTTDGIANYFWKAALVRTAGSHAAGTTEAEVTA